MTGFGHPLIYLWSYFEVTMNRSKEFEKAHNGKPHVVQVPVVGPLEGPGKGPVGSRGKPLGDLAH